MSIFIRFLSLLILFLVSLSIHAQEITYQYQLDGVYPATFPGNFSGQNIRFTILWNEKNNSIQGLYGDTFFSSNSPVTGTVGTGGRVFNVRLPRIMQGVSNISVTSTVQSLTGGTVPAMVFLRDNLGNTISQANVTPTVTVRTDAPTEEEPTVCDVGFGVLSGYCGVYTGTINEVNDSGNLCDIPNYRFGLQLNTDARVNLYFYYSTTTVGIPTHTLGTFPAVPITTGVSLTNRNCGTLVGTRFNPENCQVQTLNGTFSDIAGTRAFRGRYMITEEVTGETCSHEIVVERQLGY